MPVRELDRGHDDRHRLDPARPLMRESLAFVIPLPDEGLGVIAYTWVDAHGQAGTFGTAFGPELGEPLWEKVDGIAVPDEMTFDDWRVGPMTFGHREPLHSSTIAFAGDRLRIDVVFESIHRPYAFSSHPDGFPSYWADDRFEQSGRARGTVVVDGRVIAVDSPAHRDHSFGARAWAATTHYKWLNVLADDAAVHVFDLHGSGSLGVDDRRAHEPRLIEHYLREFAAIDPSYAADEALEDYRTQVMSGLMITTAAIAVLPDVEQVNTLILALLERNCAAVADWDAVDATRRRAHAG